MSRRRASPRRGGRPPRRGDGVPALPAPGALLTPAPPPEDPTGRRPWDFGGPIWRWALLLGFIALIAALVGPAIGACILVLEGRPVGEYLDAMGDWTVKVVGGLIGLGVVALVRRQGVTQRSQKTTVDNQFATAQRVDTIARHVAALDARHESLARSVADAAGIVAQLKTDSTDAQAGSRVAAAVAHLEALLDFAGRTGPLAVVKPEPAAAEQQPEPAAAAPDPEPVVATVVRVERHADTLPPLRPLPAPTTSSGQLRPVTGPVLEPVADPEEDRRQSAWGPAGRPTWAAQGGGGTPDPMEPADALADLLAGPRGRARPPVATTWTGVQRQVQALDDAVHRGRRGEQQP